MNKIWLSLPMVTCPHCEKEFQMDDYYDTKRGDDHDCPHCGKTMYFIYVEPVIEVEVSTEPDK